MVCVAGSYIGDLWGLHDLTPGVLAQILQAHRALGRAVGAMNTDVVEATRFLKLVEWILTEDLD